MGKFFTKTIRKQTATNNTNTVSIKTLDERKEYKIKKAVKKVADRYREKITAINDELSKKNLLIENLSRRNDELKDSLHTFESKYRRDLMRLEEQMKKANSAPASCSNQKNYAQTQAIREIKKLKAQKESFEKIVTERKITGENYYNKLISLINDDFPPEDCTRPIYNMIVNDFFDTKQLVNLSLLPYLTKFETVIRNRLDKLMYSEKIKIVKEYRTFYGYDDEHSYTLQNLLRHMVSDPQLFIDYLSENDDKDSYHNNLTRAILNRICIAADLDYKKQWDQEAISYLVVIIHDIKTIRNHIIHSKAAPEKKLSDLIKNNKLTLQHNNLIDDRIRWRLYMKLNINNYAQFSTNNGNVEINIYPVVLALLTFFNQEYITLKLLTDIRFLITTLSTIGRGKVIDRKKAVSLFRLSTKDQQLLFQIARRLEYSRFMKNK